VFNLSSITPHKNNENLDSETVESFGNQWKRYHQGDADFKEQEFLFDRYFSLVDWNNLPQDAVGFDAGCGTGRWAVLAAEKLGHLHCIDASHEALAVAKENLKHLSNCSYHECSIESMPIEKGSLDFGYSLGVLHHMPNTQQALSDCIEFLKPGAPFLVYLYYNFDNKPKLYSYLWMLSEIIRKTVTSLPINIRNAACSVIAATIYWPLAKISWLAEKLSLNTQSWPLSDYRHATFYRMQHNARDRFGTNLEQRFSKKEIKEMMDKAGLENINFRENEPYWCSLGYKKQ
jgi:ubiquinone/menaquinone biosynthesis C-methylase UbiE